MKSPINYKSWPAVPKDIVDELLVSLETRELNHTYDNYPVNTSHIDWSNSIGKPLEESVSSGLNAANFLFEEVTTRLKNWIQDNIPLDDYMSHVQLMRDGISIFPHVDGFRTIAYNYIIKANPKTVTCFYSPIDEFKDFIAYPDTYIPYDRVTCIWEERIDMYKWHELDVQQIHSVENLNTEETRIAITLSKKI